MMTRKAMVIIKNFCSNNSIDNVKDFDNTIEKMTFLKKEMFDKMKFETDHVILEKLTYMRKLHDQAKAQIMKEAEREWKVDYDTCKRLRKLLTNSIFNILYTPTGLSEFIVIYN